MAIIPGTQAPGEIYNTGLYTLNTPQTTALSPWDMPDMTNPYGTPGGFSGGAIQPNPWFNDWANYNQPQPTDYLTGSPFPDMDWDSMSDDDLFAYFGFNDDDILQFIDTDQPEQPPQQPQQPQQPGQPGQQPQPPQDGGQQPGGNNSTTSRSGGFDSSPYIDIATTVGPPSKPFWDVSNEDPDTELGQNRLAAFAWLHGADQSLLNEQLYNQKLSRTTLTDLFNAPKGYGGILDGNTGFYDPSVTGTGHEWNDILQEDMLRKGLATDAELKELLLKKHEQEQIAGNPYDAFNTVRNEFIPMSDNVTTTRDRLNEATNYYESQAGAAIDPNKLGLNPDYADQQFRMYDASIDPFMDINDPDRLGLSEDFRRDFAYGDSDVQALKDQAARYVNQRTQAQNDQLMREAAGRGNTSALALNRARQENNLYGDISAADAMTDAGLKGRGIQLDVAQGREGMRLGTEQDMANRSYDYLQSLLDRYTNTMQDEERLRLGAEQDISNRQLDTAGRTAGMKYQAGSDIGQMEDALGRFKIGTVADLLNTADQRASDRAVTNYNARTGGQQAAINTRYGQYAPASQALSDRYSQIYGQKKAEEQEGRQFLSGLYGSTMDRQNQLWNTRGGVATSMLNAANNASGGRQDTSTWDKIMQAAGVAAGVGSAALGGRKG